MRWKKSVIDTWLKYTHRAQGKKTIRARELQGNSIFPPICMSRSAVFSSAEYRPLSQLRNYAIRTTRRFVYNSNLCSLCCLVCVQITTDNEYTRRLVRVNIPAMCVQFCCYIRILHSYSTNTVVSVLIKVEKANRPL